MNKETDLPNLMALFAIKMNKESKQHAAIVSLYFERSTCACFELTMSKLKKKADHLIFG